MAAVPGDDDDILGMDDQEEIIGNDDEVEGGEARPSVEFDPLSALLKHHPECKIDYAETIVAKLPLTQATPDDLDSNHKSLPFLTQYEKTLILGKRTNQLSQLARPYVDVPKHISNVAEIARMELEQKRLPFIIKRPMPDGTFEYWRLSDLMII
jgi:DNA-directed RNA polymerase I, II, and III subunit RPABC2